MRWSPAEPCDAGERNPPYQRDGGAVTVEAALGICSIVAVLAMALGATGLMIAHLRCTDAAIEAARLVARGERDRAEQAVQRIAPAGAELVVRVQGDEITTTVSAEPLGGFLPQRWTSSSAFAVMEPGEIASARVGQIPYQSGTDQSDLIRDPL